MTGLFAYNTEIIKVEAYRLVHRKVLASIGLKLDLAYNGPAGAQILFLLNAKILVEIAAFGLNSVNNEVGFLPLVFIFASNGPCFHF